MTVPGGEWLALPSGRAFFEALVEESEAGAFDSWDMITLITGECDLILMVRPNSHGYQGLTQIGARELRALGWDQAKRGEFCRAPPEVQIRISAAYFADHRKRYGIARWTSAGHLWAANLAPAHLPRVDGVVYAELTHAAQYRANKWLDRNSDGVITRAELTDALVKVAVPRSRARYELAIASLDEVLGVRPVRDFTPGFQKAALVERTRR